MPARPDDTSPEHAGTPQRAAEQDDELRAEPAPLKQEGDALRDGSGSRHGQSPPNVDRPADG